MATAGAAAGEVMSVADAQRRRRSEFWRRMRRSPAGIVGGIVVGLLVLTALFAPLLAPYDPTALHTGVSLAQPTSSHPLGTDQLGRDVFSRVLFGARISLLIGASAVTGAVAVGVPLGLLAGYAGGWFDLLAMRLVDILLSFPFLILALLLIVVLGNGTSNVVWALSVVAVPTFARLVRATVLSVREREYVQAAHLSGASHARVLLRHILPNSLSPVIITGSLFLAVAVIAEASLSYLGLGTQPPTPSWGYDLNASLTFLEVNAWMVAGPGIAILITAMGFNLLGDGIRDVLDPRLRR